VLGGWWDRIGTTPGLTSGLRHRRPPRIVQTAHGPSYAMMGQRWGQRLPHPPLATSAPVIIPIDDPASHLTGLAPFVTITRSSAYSRPPSDTVGSGRGQEPIGASPALTSGFRHRRLPRTIRAVPGASYAMVGQRWGQRLPHPALATSASVITPMNRPAKLFASLASFVMITRSSAYSRPPSDTVPLERHTEPRITITVCSPRHTTLDYFVTNPDSVYAGADTAWLNLLLYAERKCYQIIRASTLRETSFATIDRFSNSHFRSDFCEKSLV